MKNSRKEFIKQGHKAACSEWKEKIEKEFPKLFKEDALVVGKWYVKNKCLFNYQKNSNVYGFFDGEWIKGNWCWSDKSETLATDKEVEEALIKEAKKRGFKEGVNVSRPWCDKSNVVLQEQSRDAYYASMGTLDVGTWQVFREGVWAEIIKETITKEQAEKELGKIILN